MSGAGPYPAAEGAGRGAQASVQASQNPRACPGEFLYQRVKDSFEKRTSIERVPPDWLVGKPVVIFLVIDVGKPSLLWMGPPPELVDLGAKRKQLEASVVDFMP